MSITDRVLFRLLMRITIDIDEGLLERAEQLTGISAPDALAAEALRALIERESVRRLAKLGGGSPHLRDITRRRTESG